MKLNATTTSTSLLLGFLELVTLQNDCSHKLLQLSNWIKEDLLYNTIIYMRHDDKQEKYYEEYCNTDVILKHLMWQSTTPVINLEGNTSYFLWHNFNRRLLAIAHLNGNENEDQKLLMILWKTLRRIVLTRLILILKSSVKEEYIKNILNFCFKNKALNVLVITESLTKTDWIFRFEAFPDFKMKREKLKEKNTTTLFTDQVKDMQGSNINMVMYKISSKCYILREDNGKYILGGYVGHFFTEFARKHNATLTLPNYDNFNTEIFMSDMEDLVGNNTYDVCTELSFDSSYNDSVYTSAYDYLDWCIMVPVEQSLPAYLFYVLVYDTASMVMIFVSFVSFSLILAVNYVIKHKRVISRDLIFNIYVFNGLLGQSLQAERTFCGVRSLLFMVICLAGLVFNTTYVTYLQTFNSSPPKSHIIKSLEDIKSSGLEIALYIGEYNLLKDLKGDTEFDSYVKLISTYGEYYKLRNNFDSRYAYPVHSSQWQIFEQQQNYFTQPLFRLTNLCIIKMLGMQWPLQANSPFKEAMDKIIGQIREAGLVSYWKSLAYWEAVQMGRMSLADRGTVSTFEPMKLEDMKLLMTLFGYILILLCFCFLIEVYWPHRGKYEKKFIRFVRKEISKIKKKK